MKKHFLRAVAGSVRNNPSTILILTVLAVLTALNAQAQINIPEGGFTSTTVCPSSGSLPQGCEVATNSNVMTTSGGALRLTTNSTNQVGSAWFVNPVPLSGGFQTTFQFLITNPSSTPADGIAFVIQNSPAGLGAIGFTGGNGGAIGYGDDDANSNPTSGIPNSLAIEFDTYQNGWDPDANHVAVQSCGSGYNTSHHQQLCTPSGPNSTLGIAPATILGTDILSNGQVHTVNIQYVPPSASCTPYCNNLTITLDSTSVLNVNVDLATLGLSNGNAYVGFTAATGGNDEDQDIVSWTVNTQTGQPITPLTLDQNFIFSNPPELVEFGFNYTTAYNNNDLSIPTNTIPMVTNQGINQATYAAMVAGTSLATTQCYIATGEGTDANGNPLCAQLTLECTNANSSTPEGDNCPQSIARNLFWTQIVDTPGTGGVSIPSGTAPSLAMGSDNWAPGSCILVGPEAGKLCPQSTLTQFEVLATDTRPGGGGTGTTSNSSFVLGCCQPEWSTAPTVPLWTNNPSSVPVSFKTSPPTDSLANSTNQWVPAPNKSITWGEENLGATPDTTFPVAGDQTVTNPTPCPSNWPAWSGNTPPPPPPSFTASGTVSVSGEGRYEVHYFSTACEDHQELLFPASVTTASPNNVATFKTAPFNVDTTKPTLTITLNPVSGVYALNSSTAPTATVTCTDPSSTTVPGLYSGIAKCGSQSAPQTFTGNLQTVSSTVSLSTSTLGTNTFTAIAVDAAGNSFTASVTYQVVGPDNLSIGMISSPTVKTGTNLTYDIFVVNGGPNAGSLVSVKDTLPAGTTFVSSGYAINSCTFSSGQPPQCSISAPTKSCGSVAGVCNIGTLPAWTSRTPTGAIIQITVKVTASPNTTLKNTATVSGANSNSDTKYTTATWSTTVTK